MDDEGFWDDEYERFWEQEFRKLDFSPAGRKLEHKIAELYQKEISKLDASDKKKKELTDMKKIIFCVMKWSMPDITKLLYSMDYLIQN